MDSRIDRRTALVLGGAGLAAMAAPGVAATATAGTRMLNPNDPEDERLIARKMRYRTDSGLLFSWIKGPYLAEISGDLIPMYAISVGAIQKVEQRADGGFDLTDIEISFRVDVETGKGLSIFHNPVTGEDIPVKPSVQGPNRLYVARDNSIQIVNVPGRPQLAITPHPGKPFILGDQLYFRDRSHADVTQTDGKKSTLNEISTFSAPSAEVLDPNTTVIYSRVQSNDVRSWPAWLNMGDRPGLLALFGNGGKVRRFEDMPADWLELLEQYAPAIARDPLSALTNPPKM